MPKKTKIYDMDGTLMVCGPYYDAVIEEGAKYLEEYTGLPLEKARDLINAIDLAATGLPEAFRRERFPSSFAAAALAACHLVAAQRPDVVPYIRHAERMYKIGDAVFDAPYDLYPGVRERLDQDKREGWQLLLYTKGDFDVQQSKIDKHDLKWFFDGQMITLKKDVPTLKHLLEWADVDVSCSWMIGDSLKDDIAPAQELSLQTCFVNEDGHRWSYNNANVTPLVSVNGIRDLNRTVYGEDGRVTGGGDGDTKSSREGTKAYTKISGIVRDLTIQFKDAAA